VEVQETELSFRPKRTGKSAKGRKLVEMVAHGGGTGRKICCCQHSCVGGTENQKKHSHCLLGEKNWGHKGGWYKLDISRGRKERGRGGTIRGG